MRKSLPRRRIFLMLAIMLSCVHAATDSVNDRFDGYLDRMAQLIEKRDFEAAREVLTEVREFLFDETMPWDAGGWSEAQCDGRLCHGNRSVLDG